MTTTEINTLYPEVSEILRKYYAGGYYGYDRDGRPVFYQPVGKIDFKGILHSVKPDELLNYKRLQCEYAKNECKAQEEKLGKSLGKSSTVVMDLEGFTRKSLWMAGLKSYQQIIDLLEKEYPDGCQRVLMINAPSVFQSMFPFIRLFMGKGTREKIKILADENWKTDLQEYISPENIPVYYGGKGEDVNGNPRCEECISFGGVVPESYYVNKNVDTESFENVKIKNGKTYEVRKEITTENSIIEYKFMTTDNDIGFSVELVKENGDRDIVLDFSKVCSKYVMEIGEIKCNMVGNYVFTFDNKHSWLKAKELWYSIDVRSSQ